MICIYITYTMLPIRLQEAIFGGFLISISHITLLIYLHKMNSLNMVSRVENIEIIMLEAKLNFSFSFSQTSK